jgi:3-oxoacyl-[acyl-carrier-protein] synthase III
MQMAGAYYLRLFSPMDGFAIFFMSMAGLRRGHVGTVKMSGQDVFKHAVEKLAAGLDQAIKQAGLQARRY